MTLDVLVIAQLRSGDVEVDTGRLDRRLTAVELDALASGKLRPPLP